MSCDIHRSPQAVSQFRQKRPQESSASLNNLVSCLRVLPEDKPMAWTEPQELRDMYATFCQQVRVCWGAQGCAQVYV